ncbi:Abi-alpha family protein [Elizabethkingia anophelis]|uniref:Abi-alpha family protein n=1 Tax=Elizabethkingia anophelis TaxID=1117645 RepID=UPI000389DD6A|nr:hypothetical protein [Elizabethkingia anophelis]EQB90583.1 hypothetical protein C874_16425 [Elizabethkingia anophelis 502]OPC33057.1 hypothetical protein BAX98_04240 [Elizabethkingia anophelis]
MENKFDLKSSTIDKGLEIAKNFVDKLIMPSVEETGLLVKDQITMWRFKNQIKMLNKAMGYCEKNNINPKKITLKVLAPLLEYSSLEENEEIQDKWAILLSNLIDSLQNIENHIFPYILSQLSKEEFFPLEEIYNNKIKKVEALKLKLNKFRTNNEIEGKKIDTEIHELSSIIKEKEEEEITMQSTNHDIWEFKQKKRDLEYKLINMRREEARISRSINRPEQISSSLFKEFEFSNLIRLGLVKEIKDFYVRPNQTLEIPNEIDTDWSYTSVDLDIEIDSTVEYILTELGELFFKACKEKTNISS